MGSSSEAKLATWQIDATRHRTLSVPGVLKAMVIALSITLLQVAVMLVLAANKDDGVPGETAYESLCQWDGHLYARLVRDGYRTTIPPTASIDFEGSNVAFFPGYPLCTYTLRQLSGGRLTIKSSLALAAQLSAFGFWTYWLLMLRRFRTPRAAGLILTAAVALHPASYYLVTAYSESLFLVATLGFFYWLSDPAPRRRLWAVPHGIVMSGARLGGLPVAMVPLFAQIGVEFAPAFYTAWCNRAVTGGWKQTKAAFYRSTLAAWNDRRRLARLALLGFAASLGGLAFFAYCQWRFGHWNLYFMTQAEGATVAADWIWFLRPRSYIFIGSLLYSHIDWPDDLSRLCVGLCLVLFVVFAKWEYRRVAAGDTSWPQRLPYYLCAVGLCFLHAAGVSPILMQSFFRYSLIVFVMLLLALAQGCGAGQVPAWLERPRWALLSGIGIALAGLQVALAMRYFSHQWVA
jgi:hypothetical protein